MAGVSAIAWYRPANPSGGPNIRRYPETAGQTVSKGHPVVLDSAGRVKLAVDTETGPFGIAAADFSGTTDALLRVNILNHGDIYSASGSAAGATRTTIRTDVGAKVSWILSSVSGETTKAVLDFSDTTGDAGNVGPVFEVIDLLDAVGVVDGRYLFRLGNGDWNSVLGA